jgi:hypothetical protein
MVLPKASTVVYLDTKSLHAHADGLADVFGGSSLGTEEASDDWKVFEKLADACDLDADEDVREVSLSRVSEDELLVAARLNKSAPAIVRCVAHQGYDRTDMNGRPAVHVDDFDLIAVDEHVIVVGNASGLDTVLEGASPRWLEAFGRPDGTLAEMHFTANTGVLWMVSVGLRAQDEKLTIVSTFRGKTTHDADFMLNTIRESLADVANDVASEQTKRHRKRIRRWLSRAEVRRRVVQGVELTLPLPARGKRAERYAEALKVFMKKLGTRIDSKKSELGARTILWTLAEKVQKHAAENKSGWTHMPTMPSSAPLTPSAVPSGATVTSGAEVWRHHTWKTLHFALTGEHRYAYQIVTSPDRRRTTIRAVGDHDGDGTTQTLELDVSVDGNRVVVDPYIRVENAYE